MKIKKDLFEKEVGICREMFQKRSGCNWGKCRKCGVVLLLWKLYKGVLIENKKEVGRIKREILKKSIVITFGTFDIFHKGHVSYLKQAKKLGEKLVVVVARDETVLRIKKRRARNDEKSRLEAVRNSGLADEVVLGNLGDRYAVIQRYRPSVIALGYDQGVDFSELEKKIKTFGLKTEIMRLKSYKPEIYKSSKLRDGR